MGALEEGRYSEEMMNNGCVDMGSDDGGDEEVAAIQEAVAVLLKGLGEDVNREGLRKTPLRVAKAFREGTRGYRQKVRDIIQGALFPEAGLAKGIGHAGGAGGLVVVRDLDLFSYCESCLLPFQVKCHIGYIPSGQRVIGLSKLSRVAEVFSRRLQDPQRLANEVCSALQHGIKPAGVAVVLQCSHLHFPNVENAALDENHQEWVKAEVSSGSGGFEDENSDAWVDFFSLVKFRLEKVEKNCLRNGITDSWCPCQSMSCLRSSLAAPADTDMVSAVNSILRSMGEDLSRKELVGTPVHFLKWLMAFREAMFDMKSNGYINGRTEFIRPSLEVINKHDEWIQSELNLSFWSQCEHHLLPFHGVVHIGYLCHEGSKHIGRPQLQAIVNFYGFKLQVQERLTRQIAESASPILGGDVMVVVEANHICMISRGIEKFGSNTATIAVLGRFSSDSAARSRFLSSIPNAFSRS